MEAVEEGGRMGEGTLDCRGAALWGLEEVERWGGERDHGVTAATRSTERDRCHIPMKQSLDRQPGFFHSMLCMPIFPVSSTMLSDPTFLLQAVNACSHHLT